MFAQQLEECWDETHGLNLKKKPNKMSCACSAKEINHVVVDISCLNVNLFFKITILLLYNCSWMQQVGRKPVLPDPVTF